MGLHSPDLCPTDTVTNQSHNHQTSTTRTGLNMKRVKQSKASVQLAFDHRNVASLKLNRPHRHNAYNDALIDDCLCALETIRSRKPVAVVLHGEGRSFQAGADLDWIESLRELGEQENLRASERTAEAIMGINTLPMPVLCLVHGSCFGGGTGFVAACDFVVAVERTQFAIAEVKWGLSPGIILPLLLDAVGYRNLRRYALTAERFDTDKAYEIGLVHETAQSLEEGNELIRVAVDQIVANDSSAVEETKRVLSEFRTQAEDFDRLIRLHVERRLSDSAGDGIARFRRLNQSG